MDLLTYVKSHFPVTSPLTTLTTKSILSIQVSSDQVDTILAFYVIAGCDSLREFSGHTDS